MIIKPRTKKIGYFIFLLLFSIGFSVLIEKAGWLTHVENIYYDVWHLLARSRFEPTHVVIVSIDDPTLLAHQDEPLAFWGPHFTRVIRNLRDAGVYYIGIDCLFTVSAESWIKRIPTADESLSRRFDIPFREELNKGSVILTGKTVLDEDGQTRIILPLMEYLFSLPNAHEDVGLSNLYTDDDEVVRSFVPQIIQGSEAPNLTFGPLLARKFIGEDRWQEYNKISTCLIGYSGPPGSYPRISFERVLAAAGADEDLKAKISGKIAVIAVEHTGAQDIHSTPFTKMFSGQHGGLMTGAEIQANIIDTVIEQRSPIRLPGALRYTWLAIMALAGMGLFFHTTPVTGFFTWGALNLAAAVAAYALFRFNNQLLAISDTHLTLTFAYIGTLGLRLTREERMRHRMRKAIGPYVSHAVMDQVMESESLPNLGGQTYHVTVLFSDIRDFTSISEALSAEEVVEMLNTYFSIICNPILIRGGMIDKFIGDAVMAVFGAPVPQQDHARRAICAALEMKEIAREFQTWMEKRFMGKSLPSFRVGIGLHTGRAVIGNIGSPERMGYTAVGDTVNISSRLEGMSKVLGWTIVLSRDTLLEAGEGIMTGAEDSIKVKGRSGCIDVVELLDITPS